MTAQIFDSETTDTGDDAEIIEAAGFPLIFGNPSQEDPNAKPWQLRFQPSKPIALGAMSTHHIMDEDLVGCDPSSMFELPQCEFLIGHNVDFDWKVAGSPDVNRICTLALAREIWPTLDCHTQSALIYHLDRQNARQRLRGAHNALCDVGLCKTILDAIIAETGVTSWEELWRRSEEARIPKVISFGKHKGMAIKALPPDYVRWLLNANDPPIDEYLRRALTDRQPQRTLFCPR